MVEANVGASAVATPLLIASIPYRHAKVDDAAVHEQGRQVGRPAPPRAAAAARRRDRAGRACGGAHGGNVEQGVGDPQVADGEAA